MMNKKRSYKGNLAKYLVVIPLALILLVGNAVQATPGLLNGDILSIEVQDNPRGNDEKPLSVAEVMPSYPGGEQAMFKYLAGSLKYPIKALEGKKEGLVFVKFVVGEDGTISDATVIKSANTELDKEALRVVNAMPKWTPGKQKGKAVSVYYALPIVFKIQGSQKVIDEPAGNAVIVMGYN